jgi:hypothetical protein
VFKIARLFQPRKSAFWLMLLLNALSLMLFWVIENRPLNTLGLLVAIVLALGNALWGARLAWRLVQPLQDAEHR